MGQTPGRGRAGRFGTLGLVVTWGLVLLGGCVALPVNADRSTFAAHPSRNAVPRAQIAIDPATTVLLDVRLDRQIATNGCGAHAVAAVIDYWIRADAEPVRATGPTGMEIYAQAPPVMEAGYSLADVVALLEGNGLVAVAVNTTSEALKSEVAAGRPPVVRVSLPAAYLRTSSLFPPRVPVASAIEATASDLSARMLEPWATARLDHYWIMVGYDADHVIVMDPALGLRVVRTTTFERAFQRAGALAVVVGGWA